MQEVLVRIRSKDGSPVRCDDIAKHLEAAGCYAVAVPQFGRNKRTWPPKRQTPALRVVPVNR